MEVTPQMIGLVLGVIVFCCTVLATFLLLVFGGSFKRMREQASGSATATASKTSCLRGLIKGLVACRCTVVHESLSSHRPCVCSICWPACCEFKTANPEPIHPQPYVQLHSCHRSQRSEYPVVHTAVEVSPAALPNSLFLALQSLDKSSPPSWRLQSAAFVGARKRAQFFQQMNTSE